VTPNLREAEYLVGHEFHDEQDVVDATGIIQEMGPRTSSSPCPTAATRASGTDAASVTTTLPSPLSRRW
jgi:hypothetical protein